MRFARGRAGVSSPGAAATVGAVGRTTFTRRRALLLGAAAGLGSLLAPLRGVAAFAAGGASRSRLGTRPRGFGLTVTPADFDGGRLSRVLRVRRFDLLGGRGSGHVEVCGPRSGRAWSGWIPLAAPGDHAPDTGTGERASDPVWTGGSDELQLRLARPPRGSLRVHFVAVPQALRRSAARATARARSAVAAESGAGSGAPSGATGVGAAAVAGAAVGRAAVADA